MGSYDHQFEVGDRVKVLISTPDIAYRGQRGFIIRATIQGFFVEFDNDSFGGGWFKKDELRKVTL